MCQAEFFGLQVLLRPGPVIAIHNWLLYRVPWDWPTIWLMGRSFIYWTSNWSLVVVAMARNGLLSLSALLSKVGRGGCGRIAMLISPLPTSRGPVCPTRCLRVVVES